MQNCCISFDFARYLEPKFLSYDDPKQITHDKLTVWTKISEAASRKSSTSFHVEHVS